MQVIYGEVELFLEHCHSLKEKRKIVKSIVERIRSRFNISVIEADFQDLWQRAVLAFALVAKDSNEANFILKAVYDTVASYDQVQITRFEQDYLV